MKINVIGGGPAGLYFSILMKKVRPGAQITVYERNRPDDTFGWGVVFSDETLGHFREADAPTYEAITSDFVHWDAIDIHFRGRTMRSGGHGFCGIARRRLLEILQQRAAELDVDLRFQTEIEPADIERLHAEADLLVGADGVHSKVRTHFADAFRPKITEGKARYIWLGTTCRFDAFKFFIHTGEPGVFQVHAYPFDANTSTFIVETSDEAFAAAGFDEMPVEESIRRLEEMFAEHLDGHPLLSNRSMWTRFRLVENETWYRSKAVLIGDAAHTAHFSIGSGTKLAMEDAISLVGVLSRFDDVQEALAAYEDERWVDAAKLQKTAKTSQRWFENLPRYVDDPPLCFAMNLLCRSKRVTHGNLKVRDPKFVAKVDRDFADRNGLADVDPPPPPMFVPFDLGPVRLENRVVVSPMCMYSATDGTVGDFHLVHLGSRAVGGAGLVMCEMTAVSREARITPGCAGLYRDEHVAAWRRVIDFVRAESRAKIGIQLGHAGRKGATKRPWEGEPDEPLPEAEAWPIVAPSPLPYRPYSRTPRAMTREDMDRVVADHVAAARRALEAGFDVLEIHMAHGYLLASFLSPITNRRDDAYGGDLTGRLRFPLEVLDAVRAIWPKDRALGARISAVDWIDGGNTEDDAVEIARALADHGIDFIDVSSGQTDPAQQPEYGRMYQTPFADRIKHELGIPTVTVGAILGWDHVNTIVASGRADVCAMARPHLFDPYLTLHAAAEQEYFDVPWPPQYLAAKPRPPEPPRRR